MRIGLLTVGLILIVLGLAFFMVGKSQAEQANRYFDAYAEDAPYGHITSELVKDNHDSYQKQDQYASIMMFFGGIFGITGFFFSLGGIVSSPKIKKNSKMQQTYQLDEKTRENELEVECWNCLHKFHIIENKHGPTYARCNKCGAESIVEKNERNEYTSSKIKRGG